MSGVSRAPADETAWPLLPAERTWSPLRLAVTLVTASAATWCYLIGESVGQYLGFVQGALALTAGCMIGMLLVLLAAGPASARFGIDSIAGTKPQFGARGWVVPAALQAVSIIGWNSLLLIFFGKSVAQLLATLGVVSADNSWIIVRAVSALACVGVYLVLMRGASGIERISMLLFFFIVGIGLWMTWMLLTKQADAIAAAKPSAASGSLQWDYVTGIEIGIVSLLSWWPYIGAMVREAPNAHTTPRSERKHSAVTVRPSPNAPRADSCLRCCES